jgi:hypothetical protein
MYNFAHVRKTHEFIIVKVKQFPMTNFSNNKLKLNITQLPITLITISIISITFVQPLIPGLLHGIPLALHKHIAAFLNLFTNEITKQ